MANLPPSGPDADEIRVAELADGRRAIRLAPRPEVAAGEAAEHGRPPGVRAFALQGVEDLFDGVHAGRTRAGGGSLR